jgi:hypothetical protein
MGVQERAVNLGGMNVLLNIIILSLFLARTSLQQRHAVAVFAASLKMVLLAMVGLCLPAHCFGNYLQHFCITAWILIVTSSLDAQHGVALLYTCKRDRKCGCTAMTLQQTICCHGIPTSR